MTKESAGTMDRMLQRVYSGRTGRIGLSVLFFCCCFIFLLFHVDPAIIYSSNGMNIHSYVALMRAPDASSYADLLYRHLFILEMTPQYVRDIVIAPGGWTQLAVTLCIYSCHYQFLGALLVTGLAFFLCWIFIVYLRGMGVQPPLLLRFVPAFFIMTIGAWYELGFCAYLLPVAGALVFAVFYQYQRPSTLLTSVFLTSVLFWLAWYLMSWGCLLMILLVVIHERCRTRHMIVPVALAALGNGVLFYVVETSSIPLAMTIRWNEFIMFSGFPLIMIGYFPFTAIILVGLNRYFHYTPAETTKRLSIVVQMSLLLCGSIAAGIWLYREPVNRDTRTVARTVHHIMNGQWEEVLREKTAPFFTAFPQKSGLLQVFMIHAVNHALCRTGQLGDRLFSYPQAVFSYDPLLMLQSMFVHGYVNWVVVLDLAMDLGMVNTAEKIAGELMENMGPYPDIIYRRSLVQIVKGNREAAAVYLNKLAGMPFYRTEAKRLLAALQNNESLLFHPRITAMSANRDTVDYFLDNNLSGDVILRHLLQSNPANKAAYDYLMTYYLLYDRLDEVDALVPAAPAFGYTVLPRYWDEGRCLYQSTHTLGATSSGDPFAGLPRQTVERFITFTKAWVPIKDDPEAGIKLAPQFGDSYFYFSIFRHSPGIFHE